MPELIRHYQQQDPVQPGFWETVLTYPGLHAVFFHRINHWLWQRKFRLFARFGSHIARFLTGIEIHPGATLGEKLFIDHGMGIVIGETAVVGNNVTIYHGVTLGGLGIPATAGTKRHPNIEDNVILGTGVKILGNITIGQNCRIAPNCVVMEDIPANSTVKHYTSQITIKTKAASE